MTDQPPYPGTPGWVKAAGIVIGVLVLLSAIVIFTGVGGPHGPGRHLPSHGAGGQTTSGDGS